MTRRIDDALLIEEEEPAVCSDCEQTKELRPYGRNGAAVCFECAMKDKKTVEAQFASRLMGDEPGTSC